MNKLPDSGYHIYMLIGLKPLVAGVLAVSFAWIWDRCLYHFGLDERLRIQLGIPVGEEIIKYATGSYFQIPILLIYVLFGFGEGILEAVSNYKYIKTPLNIIYLVLAGCLTHLLFGFFFLTTFPIYLQLLLAMIAHISWNSWVLRRES